MKATIGVVAMQTPKHDEVREYVSSNDDDDDDDDKTSQVTMVELLVSSEFWKKHYASHMVVRSVGIFQTRCVTGLQLSLSDSGAQPAVMIATNTQKYVAEFAGKYKLVLTVGCNVLVGWSVSAAFSVAGTYMAVIYAFGPISGGHVKPGAGPGCSSTLGGGRSLDRWWLAKCRPSAGRSLDRWWLAKCRPSAEV